MLLKEMFAALVAVLLGGDVGYVDAYDGDTVTVAVTLEVPIRVLGVDTPEIASRCADADARTREKAAAIEARDFVRELLSSAEVIELVNVDAESDPYGRPIATVIVDGRRLDRLLIDAPDILARPYFGDGATRPFC